MRNFLRYTIVFWLVLVGSAAVTAREPMFDEIVDFDATLRTLTRQVQRMEPGETSNGPIYILDGFIASVTVPRNQEGPFRAEVELVSGEWHGLERVVLYRALVVVDDYFQDRTPARPPANPQPGTITADMSAIVVGRLIEVREDPQGRHVPVIEARYVRTRR